MKKIFIFLFILIFLSNGISALTLDMPEELNQKQSFLVNISGEFYSPLTENNIIFYRENLKVPLNFELEKINDNYYLFGISTLTPGNYSLKTGKRELKNTEDLFPRNYL